MELVYTYIERYNCLEEVGLDFSEEFSFEFKKEKGTLIINKSEKRIDNFFSKNISNISAIIGRNGVGKTTACEYIFSFIGNYYLKTITVFKSENSLIIIASDILKRIEDKTNSNKIIKYVDNETDLSYIHKNLLVKTYFFSSSYDTSLITSGKSSDISNSNILQEWLKKNKKKKGDLLKIFHVEEILKDLDFLNSTQDKKELIDSTELYNHLGVYFNCQIRGTILGKMANFKFVRSYNRKLQASSKTRRFSRDYLNKNGSNKYLLFETFVLITFYVQLDYYSAAFSKMNVSSEDKMYLNEITNLRDRKEAIEKLFGCENINQLMELLEKDYKLLFKNEINYFKVVKKGIDKDFILEPSFPEVSEFVTANIELFQFKISKYFLAEFYNSYLLTTEAQEYLSIHYKISTGEKAHINFFSRLWSKRAEILKEQKPVLLILDEPEVNLHPNWSKEFINKLIIFLNKYFKSVKFQIILTSHSPHLISDIPSGSIVFLDKRNGKTVSIAPEDLEVNTFAGNISQMLLNSFFVDGTFVGGFSKKRIREAYKLLEGDLKSYSPINSDNVELFISKIGDSYIKQALEKINVKRNDD
jgi:predicted ATP-dependent endonuclease of OLD family